MQKKSEDKDYDKGIGPIEASSFGHVVNAYQCSQAVPKTNTEKHPPRQNDHYNLRSKGAYTWGNAREDQTTDKEG